jgi:hypothetical protein
MISSTRKAAKRHKCDVILGDSENLLHYGIIGHTQISLSCPLPNPAPADATLQPHSQAAEPPFLPSGSALQSPTPMVQPGVQRGALIVSFHGSVPGDKKMFSFTNLQPRDSIASLKQVISGSFGIPAIMQTIKTHLGLVLAHDCDFRTIKKPIECHLMRPSHIYIRLRLNDGRENMQQVAFICEFSCDANAEDLQVEVSLSETFLSLKQRVAQIFNASANDIVFLVRDNLSIFIPNEATVGCYELVLCENPWPCPPSQSRSSFCVQGNLVLF